jgi:hypothetical protein
LAISINPPDGLDPFGQSSSAAVQWPDIIAASNALNGFVSPIETGPIPE